MSSARINDRMPQFEISAKHYLKTALKEAASDFIKEAKRTVPRNKSHLQQSIRLGSPISDGIRIISDERYSAFQEYGGDSNRRVRRYTSPGTGKHFFKNAGKNAKARLPYLFKKHGSRARV